MRLPQHCFARHACSHGANTSLLLSVVLVFYAFFMNYAQKSRKKQRFTLYIAIHILRLFFRTVHAFLFKKQLFSA